MAADGADGGGGLSGLRLDRAADVPPGTQLAWALRSRIGEGRLAPSQRLPALRELAEAVGVNVNTVRAVYQRLEREGLIEIRQGSGTFVSPAGAAPSPAGEIAAGAAREALERGVDPREVATALYVSSPPPAPEASDPDRREALRGQIRSLDRVLGELEAAHPRLIPPARTRRGRGPALLDTAELEAVRAHIVQRLTAIQQAIEERAQHDPPAPERSSRRVQASDPGREQAVRAPRRKQAAAAPAPEQKQAPRRKQSPRPRPAPAGG